MGQAGKERRYAPSRTELSVMVLEGSLLYSFSMALTSTVRMRRL